MVNLTVMQNKAHKTRNWRGKGCGEIAYLHHCLKVRRRLTVEPLFAVPLKGTSVRDLPGP